MAATIGWIDGRSAPSVSADVTGAEVAALPAGVDRVASMAGTGSARTSASEFVRGAPTDPPPILTKAFLPDAIDAGTTSTLILTIDNSASDASATALDVTDDLPSGMVVADPATAATTCTGGTITAVPGSSVVAYTDGSVSAQFTCTISVNVTAASASTYVNTTGDLTSSLGNSGPASATLTVRAPIEADVSVSKTDGVDVVVPGGSTTYTIEVANAGPSADPAVSLTDVFPAGLSCGWTSSAVGGATGNTVAGAGDLAEALSMPDESSVTYTVECSIDPAATGSLSNTVSVAGSVVDPNPSNNESTDVNELVPEADVSVSKTDGVDVVVPGGSTTYTIEVANAGPSADPAVSLTDVFPGELSCGWTSVAAGGATGNTVAGAGDLVETLSMPHESSVTYTVECSIDPAATGSVANTAVVAPSVVDPNASNNESTDVSDLEPTADLSVDNVATPIVQSLLGGTRATARRIDVVPGNSVRYAMTVRNVGPSVDPAARFRTSLPSVLTCSWRSTATGGATGSSGSGVGPVDEMLTMPPGSTLSYDLLCAVDPAARGQVTTTAEVVSSIEDPDTSNNTASNSEVALLPSADLSVTKTDGATTAIAGGTVEYTMRVRNVGPSAEPAARVVDVFPAGLTCSYTSTAEGGATGNTSSVQAVARIDDTLSMPPGSGATYRATCSIGGDVRGAIENRIAVTASVDDPDLANNEASDSDTVVQAAGDLPATGGSRGLLAVAFVVLLAGLLLVVSSSQRRRALR